MINKNKIQTGFMAMVKLSTFSEKKMYSIIGPIFQNYVPILIPSDEKGVTKYPVNEKGHTWYIDYYKYKDKFFLRIPIDKIIATTHP